MKRRFSFLLHGFTLLVRLAILVWAFVLSPGIIAAQDEDGEADESFTEAAITISFAHTDTTRTLMATVMSDTVAVPDVDVYFYVSRTFSLLPLDFAVTTDEEGKASVNFPMDLPGDENGMVEVVVRIEDDDTYGNVEARKRVQWGVPVNTSREDHWADRSLSASRLKAPTYLIVASNVIIAVIWGTIAYVVYLVYRIWRIGKKANVDAART